MPSSLSFIARGFREIPRDTLEKIITTVLAQGMFSFSIRLSILLCRVATGVGHHVLEPKVKPPFAGACLLVVMAFKFTLVNTEDTGANLRPPV